MSARLDRTSCLILTIGSKQPVDSMGHSVFHPDFGPTITARQPTPASEQRICDSADVQARVRALPRPLVFTNGVFDILRHGHATYLAQAHVLGASLVVGVSTDASVRTLSRGDDRPLNAQDDRLAVLAALKAANLVVLFAERTPVELVQCVHPDVYVRGGDYDIGALGETRVVRSWGGTALTIPFEHDRSTTALLKCVRATS